MLFHAAIPFVPPTSLTDSAYVCDRTRNITSKVKFISPLYEWTNVTKTLRDVDPRTISGLAGEAVDTKQNALALDAFHVKCEFYC